MLYIDYGLDDSEILDNPTARYRAQYETGWFDDPEVVRIAETIDRLKHDGGDAFMHPVLGRCTGYTLSGGAVTVILAYLGETGGYALPLSWLGENCFSVLGSLDIKHDVVFDGDYTPRLDEWNCSFISKKTGKVVDGFYSHLEGMVKYVIKRRDEEDQI